MSITGIPTISTMEIPVRDLPTFQVTVTKDGTAPLDLTNYAIAFAVFKNKEDLDADALFTKTLSAGIAVLNAVQGIYEVTLEAADVAKLSAQQLLFFRSTVTTPDNRPGAVTSGYLILTP